jgi:quercetin dioxygenase-like cupin family protein
MLKKILAAGIVAGAVGVVTYTVFPTSVNDQITDSVTQVPNPNIERSNLINGKVPPNTPTKTMFETRLLTIDQLDAKGNPTGWVTVTSRSVRDFGTRSPIHVHPYGGQTCVVSGEMTLYLDGDTNLKTAQSGECYWMPAGRRMSGVNSAKTPTIMIDTFVVPKGEQVWIVVEPGMEDSQDQFDKLFHTHKH